MADLPALSRLAECLLTGAPDKAASVAEVALHAAADRAGEVRVALRWLKERILIEGCAPDDLALIARIDRLADGSLRVIDYKLGVSDYDTTKALVDGKRLHLPLYALAAERLGLGAVRDGVYWFVTDARPSKWSLESFEAPETGTVGATAAIDLAVAHAHAAVQGARAGNFQPTPPATGCPEYCPAAGFCWRYAPKDHG